MSSNNIIHGICSHSGRCFKGMCVYRGSYTRSGMTQGTSDCSKGDILLDQQRGRCMAERMDMNRW